MIKSIVTDIEGTTSALSFVTDTLFPFARRHLRDFIAAQGDEPQVQAQLKAVREAAGTDADVASVLERWMDEDRKAPPLKALQGMIWQQGYEDGELRGHVYDDAVKKLRDWHERGVALYVYSSGSVQAQKLLFKYSGHGDLTPLFSGYFDTRTGAKREPASYRRIAEETGDARTEILFLSDVAEELDAAQRAGFATRWLVRDAEPDPEARHVQIRTFGEVDYWLIGPSAAP